MTFTSGALVDETGGVTQHAIKIHNPDEELRLLRDDRDKFLKALSDVRLELGVFAEDGRPTVDCLRDMKADYEAEIKRLRKVVIENEIDRNDDWIRSELKGDQE